MARYYKSLTRKEEQERKQKVFEYCDIAIKAIEGTRKPKVRIFEEAAKEFGYAEPNSVAMIYYNLKKK